MQSALFEEEFEPGDEYPRLKLSEEFDFDDDSKDIRE